MAEESEKGHTPALLGQFLRERFPKRTGGWLSRWLSGPCNYDVRRIDPFEDGGFFRRSCVFSVFACDQLLEAAILPSGGTHGLFALGPRGLRYLNHRRDNTEELLRSEGRSLDECDPLVLASLVVEALGRERNNSHDVVESPDQLTEYQGGQGKSGGGYELNAREWGMVRASVVSPVISGSAVPGWQLEFCSVFGWMHEKRVLVRHRYRFGPDFHIEQEKEVLSRRIFMRMPSIRY